MQNHHGMSRNRKKILIYRQRRSVLNSPLNVFWHHLRFCPHLKKTTRASIWIRGSLVSSLLPTEHLFWTVFGSRMFSGKISYLSETCLENKLSMIWRFYDAPNTKQACTKLNLIYIQASRKTATRYIEIFIDDLLFVITYSISCK